MRTCEYCHAELPGDAAFCGSCGRVQSAKLPSTPHDPSSYPPLNFATALMPSSPDEPVPPPASDARTTLSASLLEEDPLAGRNMRGMGRATSSSPAYPSIADMPTLHGEPYANDEEEKKRPLPLYSRIFPVIAGAEAFNMPDMSGGQAPWQPGVPDPGTASMLPGTPHIDGAQSAAYAPPSPSSNFSQDFFEQATAAFPPAENSFAPSFPSGNTPYPPPSLPPQMNFPLPPVSSPYTPPFSTPPPFPSQPLPHPGTGGKPKGCALWAAILIVPLLLLASVFGLGFTVFAPQISLSGTPSVNPGDTLHIHGHGFLANTTIILTIDDNRLIQLASQPSQTLPASLQTQDALLSALTIAQAEGNTLKTSSSGTFNADIAANASWSPGRHVLHAQEGMTPRQASLVFTVLSQSDVLPPPGTVTPIHPATTPTPAATAGATATATAATNPGATPTLVPTAKPTSTPTPTVVSQLSSLTPTTLALGSVAQNSTQSLSGQTTLSATGNALVSWNASWNQQQASWLQVSPSSGQISTPGSQQIVVSASAGTLQPGNYSTTISISSPSNAHPLTLNVSFTIQGTCLTANPTTLAFTGTQGTDPAGQTLGLTNCGAAGAWTATATTTDGANWLTATPASGTLTNGITQTITVNTIIAATQLMPGTYTGTLLFTSGTAQVSVSVTLTVQATVVQSPATIQVSPTAMSLATDCKLVRTTYQCQVTLTALNATQAITWKATSDYALTRFSAATGTITTGQPVTITILLYRVVCPGSTITVTFTGPNNTASVTLSC